MLLIEQALHRICQWEINADFNEIQAVKRGTGQHGESCYVHVYDYYFTRDLVLKKST